ncbi:hypothetical protein PILCRDRAFT_707429 [Piloderma croceum F 1598]|uniref:Peptidase A1 domain-containing protein n=1 Tax=Piloderma croceum (strain F 1598) TaxID=765440 RepID=A0A0C3AKB7_PILCF|nr:hypothetical protein PILCRDRAFT_707429 [Piloderma croceum F 1598]
MIIAPISIWRQFACILFVINGLPIDFRDTNTSVLNFCLPLLLVATVELQTLPATMTLFNFFAALLLCGAFVLASSPAPTATPFSSKDLRPRFLQEAASLPRAGIFKDSVYTFPLVKKRASNSPAKAKRHGMIQLSTSDLLDEAYGIAISIGGQEVHLTLDTGASDLWVVTSSCKTPNGHNCTSNPEIPLYTPSKSFQSQNESFSIAYGAGPSSTFVSGKIGTDNVAIGNLSLLKQTFGSTVSTNDTIVNLFSGIFGMGHAGLSELMSADFEQQLLASNVSSMDAQSFLEIYFKALEKNAPLVPHMAASELISKPMFSMTLQREEPTSEGSNLGVLTLGGLPSGVSNDSLTWVPVKHYPTKTVISGHLKNLTVPTLLMNEVSKMLPSVPLRLEVPIDGLYVNGQMLLNSSEGNLTALLDSGTARTLLPSGAFKSPLLPQPDANGFVPCSTLYNISIGIGGQIFSIHPFDLVIPNQLNDTANCISGLGEASPPTETSTFSFLFGTAFFRSNLVAINLGNITNSKASPSSIGFL